MAERYERLLLPKYPLARSSGFLATERATEAGRRSLAELNTWTTEELTTKKVALSDFVRNEGLRSVDFVKTYTGTTTAKAEFHELMKENKHLHKRIQSSSDPAVIEGEAREQGLVAEGERPIRINGLR